jgi:hypothetical protein
VQGNRWLVAKMFGVLMICEFFSFTSASECLGAVY